MKIVGYIQAETIYLLNLKTSPNTPIFLGQSNIDHMEKTHPDDYLKYYDSITLILAQPDYIGMNPADDSIEYVKEFIAEYEYVKVAVRISASGKFFARSLYTLNTTRVNNFISKGTLKKVDNRQ